MVISSKSTQSPSFVRSKSGNVLIYKSYVAITSFVVVGLIVFYYFTSGPVIENNLEITSSTIASRHSNHLLSFLNHENTMKLTNDILKDSPRVPDSENIRKVRASIIKFFRNNKWSVQEHSFTANTIIGKKEMVNLIMTQPKAPLNARRIIFAAHYDSKLFEDIMFLGAIDSAVPCAILMETARAISLSLDKFEQNGEVQLQIIFFDGEEAFKEWTTTDSLYGSRALAKEWEEKDKLKDIQVMVLLDLLGADNPSFHHPPYLQKNEFFPSDTRSNSATDAFNEFQIIEKMLRGSKKPYFYSHGGDYQTQDDHIPFYQRNVPIVHMIAMPFPPQWHKASDTSENLSESTIKDLTRIVYAFALKQLGLWSEF